MQRYPEPKMDEAAGVLDRRAEALLIDGLLTSAVIGFLGYVAGTLLWDSSIGGFGGLVIAVQFVMPVVLLFYQAGFEGYYGQTVGKYLRGIVVVGKDGSQCSWGAAVVRSLLRIVDALPLFYVTGIVSAYVTTDHQRLGDLAASTVVVYTEENEQ